MATITVKTVHTVKQANDSVLEAIATPFWLGPMEHMGYPIPMNVVWMYAASPENPAPVSIPHLQLALSHLLDAYPTLTGRYCMGNNDSAKGRRSVDRFGTGIELLEAVCDVPLSTFGGKESETDFDVFTFPKDGDALLAPWDATVEGVENQPLLTVQHTRFSCGAVALGLRMAHQMCDAGGFLHLYQDLAFLYRELAANKGEDANKKVTLPALPELTPFMADKIDYMSDEEREKALAETPRDFYLVDETEPNMNIDPPLFRITSRSLHFSVAELKILKEKAIEPGHDSTTSWVSSFSALAAHFFQRVHIARLAYQADHTKEEYPVDLSNPAFLASVNIAARLGLRQPYFPNAVTTPFYCPGSAVLASQPFWQVAHKVQSLIRDNSSLDPASLRHECLWVAAVSDRKRIRGRFPYGPASFVTSGWHRMPLYQGSALDDPDKMATFASPVFTACAPVDGLAYFLQPKEGASGGIDVVFSLAEPLWAYIDKDKEFRCI